LVYYNIVEKRPSFKISNSKNNTTRNGCKLQIFVEEIGSFLLFPVS